MLSFIYDLQILSSIFYEFYAIYTQNLTCISCDVSKIRKGTGQYGETTIWLIRQPVLETKIFWFITNYEIVLLFVF